MQLKKEIQSIEEEQKEDGLPSYIKAETLQDMKDFIVAIVEDIGNQFTYIVNQFG